MRILGFSKRWAKLEQKEFSTFRLPRRDQDWAVGEQVQVVFQPRRKGGGEFLGEAEIINNKSKVIREISEEEAITDGFANAFYMWLWLKTAHKGISMEDTMNKLTLSWVRRV